MDAFLRSVPAGSAEEVTVGETGPIFEEFYEATFGRVFTALRLITGNRHEAEEVAQDAYVRVFERWDRVGALEDPTGYLFLVSMSRRDRKRRNQRIAAGAVGMAVFVAAIWVVASGVRFDGTQTPAVTGPPAPPIRESSW